MSDLLLNEEIRALSWKEPFASLMLHGKIETRTWDTKYRGLVLICASKQQYGIWQVDSICGGERHAGRIVGKLGQFWGGMATRGKAIAVGRLIDSRRMRPEDEDKCFVQYRPDLFCHVYEYVRAIEPFPWKGSQGWRKLDEETKRKIILK